MSAAVHPLRRGRGDDTPPHDLAAEEAVLGAGLLSAAALDAAVDEGLEAGHFYRERHGRVFGAMSDLRSRGVAVDLVTLVDELRDRGQLADVGGEAAVDSFAASVPAAGNARHYARIVRACAEDRQRRIAALRLIEDPRDPRAHEEMRAALDAPRGLHAAPQDWLAGAPMDPAAVELEPLSTVPGFPMVLPGAGVLIVGPTGGGRSSLVQVMEYDGAAQGVRTAYLGSEVTAGEFNARAADLAARRGDRVGAELREQLAHARYLDLAAVIGHAWRRPDQWVAEIVERFHGIIIDPLSAVAAALDLDFDQSNAEFVRFYDRIVQPLTAAGVFVILLDNVGHAQEARSRAKGASAKQDRVDLSFACKLRAQPVGLIVTASKVRSVRAPFHRGSSWVFDRDTQRIHATEGEPAAAGDEAPFRPTVLMERTSLAVEGNPGLTARALRDLVSGKNTAKALALELLVAEGYVEARPGDRYATHYSTRPYREISDTGPRGPLAVPGGSPEPPDGTGSLVPFLNRDQEPGTATRDSTANEMAREPRNGGTA